MMKRMILLVMCSFLTPSLSWACEYGDDPRIESDVLGLIKSIKLGKERAPIRMTLGTYLGMSPKTRLAFGENITISSKACNPVSVFEGEVTGKVSIPFEEYYRTVARSIIKNRQGMFLALKKHGQVAPMPVESFVDLFGKMPFSQTGGIKVRNRMKQLFPEAGSLNPKQEWLKDPAMYGRMEDYTMARLFKVWGGELILNKGCGPYTLTQQFYASKDYKDRFTGKKRTRTTAWQYKPRLMMRVMGPYLDFYSRSEVTRYKIKGCTP